jgi:hypothetical protein
VSEIQVDAGIFPKSSIGRFFGARGILLFALASVSPVSGETQGNPRCTDEAASSASIVAKSKARVVGKMLQFRGTDRK